MALNTNDRLQEAFSLALEDRSQGYADLVSNSNALLLTMKKRNQFKTFSGPTIRERLLYNESGTYTRYAGYEFLNPQPAVLKVFEIVKALPNDQVFASQAELDAYLDRMQRRTRDSR